MSTDGRPPDDDLLLQPTVRWPREMTVGQRHLVEVDLALVTAAGTPAPWPLEAEEYTYICALDGGADFGYWAVHDACVVLHRFGGSYGPAQFVVTPRQKTGDLALWLTIANQWGVPVGDYQLEVSVTGPEEPPPATVDEPPEALEPTIEELVPAGLSPTPELDRLLAAGDEMTVDIPYQELTVPDALKELAILAEAQEALAATRSISPVAPLAGPSAPTRRDVAHVTVRLPEWYNVAGLRRSPGGSLHWDMLPLFSPGAASGDRVTFTARCMPTDERGTVFAVLAEPRAGAGRAPELLSVQSAKVPPGIYRVTAELLYPGPGHVRFHGLPEQPREDQRRWSEISTTVPARLEGDDAPAHLIAAIEISGSPGLVRERVEAVTMLVSHVAAEAKGFVCYSVMTYGPHSIDRDRNYPEVPVTTLAWAEIADDALAVLARLARESVPQNGYDGAAQLECLLTDLDTNLTGQEGRPVIVTAGTRPPHPPRTDATQVIPCRYRRDWRVPMSRLRGRHAGIAFGSIRDAGRADELWEMLGVNATFGDHFAPEFARSLGLTTAIARPIALPMFSTVASGVRGGPRSRSE